MREALDIFLDAHGENHPSTFQAQEALARIVRASGRPEEARDLVERSLAGRRVFFGDKSLEVGFALSALAQAQRDLKNLDEAERSALEALEIYQATYGKPHTFSASVLRILGSIEMDRGNPAAAQVRFEEAVAMLEAAVGEGHTDTLACLTSLAECMESRTDWTGALATYDTILVRCGELTPAVRRALAHQGRGRCLVGLGRATEAISDHREALATLADLGPTSASMVTRIARAREELALAQERAGDAAGAAETRASQVVPSK